MATATGWCRWSAIYAATRSRRWRTSPRRGASASAATGATAWRARELDADRAVRSLDAALLARQDEPAPGRPAEPDRRRLGEDDAGETIAIRGFCEDAQHGRGPALLHHHRDQERVACAGGEQA